MPPRSWCHQDPGAVRGDGESHGYQPPAVLWWVKPTRLLATISRDFYEQAQGLVLLEVVSLVVKPGTKALALKPTCLSSNCGCTLTSCMTFGNCFFFLKPGFLSLCVCFMFLYWLHRVLVVAFSCPLACGILVPWTGIKPASPVLESRCLTTGPSGNFLGNLLNLSVPQCFHLKNVGKVK